mgnify:CR=1 FL=1
MTDGKKPVVLRKILLFVTVSSKGLHGVVLGSEMSSGIQHVFVENCTYGGYCKRGTFYQDESGPRRFYS